MGLQRYFPEEIDESNGEVQVLGRRVGEDIEKEANELEEVEALLEVLAEELNYLYVVLFHVEEDAISVELAEEGSASLVVHVDDAGDEFLAEDWQVLGSPSRWLLALISHIELAIVILNF